MRRKMAEEAAAAQQAAGAAAAAEPEAPLPLPTDFSKDLSGGTARFGFAVRQGQRSRMEDAVDAQPQLLEKGGVEFYAVYDGHGGTDCADFVRKNLRNSLRRSHSGLEDAQAIRASLTETFVAIDTSALAHLKEVSVPKSTGDQSEQREEVQDLTSGTVAVVALVKEGVVHVANCGDSRAVLCVDGRITALSKDHTPKASEEERARLQALGVEVASDGYMHGGLAVSRALGDLNMRSQKKCTGLTAEPEIMDAEITADAEFLLLASDGIWEVIETEEAGRIVRRRLRSSGSPQAAAEALVSNASAYGSSDNISVVVVMFKRPPSL